MSKCMLRSGLVVLLVAGLLGFAPSVQAQFNFNSNLNPGFVLGLSQAQYMAYLQQAAAARAAGQAQTLYPVNPTAQVNPYGPATTNPYTPGMTNPYNSLGMSGASPYQQSNTTPYPDPGSVLRGQADVMRAYGTVITSQEQARITREQALQANLETRKKEFELNQYIKANTPTYTDEQAKIAKMTLKRIQTNSSESEIVNGKALNLFLNDMRKYPGKKVDVEPFALSEKVLRHLNVTGGSYSLGVLRNGGEFAWPVFFQEYFAPSSCG